MVGVSGRQERCRRAQSGRSRSAAADQVDCLLAKTPISRPCTLVRSTSHNHEVSRESSPRAFTRRTSAPSRGNMCSGQPNRRGSWRASAAPGDRPCGASWSAPRPRGPPPHPRRGEDPGDLHTIGDREREHRVSTLTVPAGRAARGRTRCPGERRRRPRSRPAPVARTARTRPAGVGRAEQPATLRRDLRVGLPSVLGRTHVALPPAAYTMFGSLAFATTRTRACPRTARNAAQSSPPRGCGAAGLG